MLGIYVKFQGATLLPYSYSMTSGDSYCWWAEILANQHVGWLKTHRTRLLLSGFSHQRACNFRWRGLCYIRDTPLPQEISIYVRKHTFGDSPIIGNNPSRRTNNIISSSFQMSFFSPKNSFRKRHTQQKPPRTLSLMLSSQKRVAAIAMGHGYP